MKTIDTYNTKRYFEHKVWQCFQSKYCWKHVERGWVKQWAIYKGAYVLKILI